MPFSSETIRFLTENRRQNSRAWFEEHREEYELYVMEPLKELTAALGPYMRQIDEELTVEPRVDRTISRIRRDTRFSRDKSLYRDNMWIIFKRGQMHGTAVPGFYFEFGPEGYSYGCGFYAASPSYMDTMRSLILQGCSQFEDARRAYESQQTFVMEGEKYKRPHYRELPENLRDWLERRGICFCADYEGLETMYEQDLWKKIRDDLRLVIPIYDFLLLVSQTESRQKPEAAIKQFL
ncbi:DUF2461 domain-containing protein [Lachnotalea sp. AF33-28]|jgi:uncharacterized protein (TIGR02453 family)|uniref:DUF2461 domain-containing protein n=1 Tax=Lachnotalea sp. AF33-28 TaxID=2292046 RepID=UPI000E50BB41|nr:DUF2461 domain-containing protein [Lachnotalea sp. AF33-28]RHP31749.1 DUF2461 domain-containing protein [Lachnotalea sp. AF33-28]